MVNKPNKPENPNKKTLFSRILNSSLARNIVLGATLATNAACTEVLTEDNQPALSEEDEAIIHKYSQIFEIARQELPSEPNLQQRILEQIRRYQTNENNPLSTTITEYHEEGRNSDFSIPSEETTEMYVHHVAFNIYLDLSNQLPWKIEDLEQEELYDLFKFYQGFNRIENEMFIIGDVIPSEPRELFDFIKENDLLGETREETIYKLIDFIRIKFKHASTNERNNTPVTILEKLTTPGEQSIGGCHSTAFLMRDLATSIGIPASREDINYGDEDHSRIEFSSLSSFHADDLHSMNRSTGNNVPSSEILVQRDGIDFTQDQDFNDGVLKTEILYTYMPDNMLLDYALGVKQGDPFKRIWNPHLYIDTERADNIIERLDATLAQYPSIDDAIADIESRIIRPE